MFFLSIVKIREILALCEASEYVNLKKIILGTWADLQFPEIVEPLSSVWLVQRRAITRVNLVQKYWFLQNQLNSQQFRYLQISSQTEFAEHRNIFD